MPATDPSFDVLRAFAAQFVPPSGFAAVGPEAVPAICLSALTGAADALLAATLTGAAEAGAHVVLAIVPGLPDADRLADDLRVLAGLKGSCADQIRVLEFPPSLGGEKAALGVRLKTAAALRSWADDPCPCVVVASFPALAATVPTGTVPGIALGLAMGDGERPTLADLAERLSRLGYRRVPMVEGEGDFSVRGGILDAWSPGEDFPMRAEFFGDDLESLRTFDPATQLSVERMERAVLLSACEGGLVASGSLLDLLPDGTRLVALDHNAYALDSLAALRAERSASLPPTVYTGDPAPQGVPTVAFQTVPLPGFAELGADEAHHPELFDAARQRLDRHLAAFERGGGQIARLDALSGGFELGQLAVVARADRVFAKRRSRRSRTAGVSHGLRQADFDSLEPGEYVVHIDYGVGRYIGSSEIVVDGKRSEVFTIEYADGGKLHVPAAHAHLLTRYVGVKGEAVRLHRLDGKRWARDRKEAQKAVSDLAAALLETQARREAVPGFAHDVECDGLEAFEAAFPYEETPDQAAAIAAVKRDMAATKPMDRLICGDAGYGKTEVAMRAAYIAALNGKQVAVLAPTTVLAEQHFETFTARFDGTPVRIESVSRFQSAHTHDGTFKRLASGACDIVIGTHAILSGRIRFRDLGLIVIDEEQRFGVRHKEFLKALRTTADVLTLSATPIPRTLYLSMTGARDLSLLRTPPRERVAVETKVVRDSDEVVGAAVESELERGGQVYFLHNRVSTLSRVERRLKALCPRARIVAAHGQMDSRTLALKMREFERGEYDILLSTTIIESGIDIPRANTIFIDRADTFGMADLYQLRGRVGRSSRQGYAVFLLPPDGVVDSDARERLAALQRHGGLGSGFNLAVRDLELRGAGNLLGSQQSGHIAAVGFTLYCQLLQRTVALLKGERVKEVVDVKLNLDFIDLSPASEDAAAAAALPYDYVEEDVLRMNFMRRFAEAGDSRDVRALACELEDRFGRLPPPAARFVRLAKLRVACAASGYDRIDAKGDRAVFYRAGSRQVAKVADLRGKTADRRIAELVKAVAD